MSGCSQHGLPTSPEKAHPFAPYYVARCHHKDNRFITEVHNATSDYIVIDYVQLGEDFIVEPHHPQEKDVEETWLDLVERIERGDPPRKE